MPRPISDADHSPRWAYRAVLPGAVLIAGAFPVLPGFLELPAAAHARENDAALIETPDARTFPAHVPELSLPLERVAQKSGEPPDGRRSFDIGAQPLDAALLEFADRTGIEVFFEAEQARGLRSKGARGRYSPDEALRRLVEGTGLTYRFANPTTVTLEPASESDPQRFELEGTTVEAVREPAFKAEEQTSATKMPLSVRETPQAVTVITEESLEARQVQDLGQALETSASVFQFTGTGPFAGKDAFGFDKITIRGMELDGNFGVLEDGFVSPNNLYKPDLALYERVEVVKGPSSVLYGRGSSGGLINRVRKKPLPEFQAEIAPSVGSFDTYRLDADVTGPVVGPARGRMVAVYEQAGAFVDRVDSERILVAPGLEVDLTESTRLLLLGSYQRDRFTPNPGIPLLAEDGEFRAPRIRRSLFVGIPSEDENDWEFLAGTTQLEQALGDRWLATLRVNGSRQDTPIDLDSYAYGIRPGGDVSLYSSEFDFDTDTWAGEVRLDGDLDVLGKPLTLTFGVDHQAIDAARQDSYLPLGTANIYEQNFDEFPTMDPSGNLVRDEDTDNDGTGVYLQGHFRPLERLGLLAGVRHDWVETSRENKLADVVSERDDEELTARAGLTFDLTRRITAYGLFAQSFSPPARSQVDENGNILKPETGESYEVGLKSEWLEGRLAVNAALFRIERDDVAIFDPTNQPGEFDSVATGLQRSDGTELEIHGEPLPGWNVSFGGMLLDSEFRERDDPFFGSTPGGTAEWQVGLYTGYELQRGIAKGLGLGVGFFAIDERGLSTFIPGGVVAGYERVDLSAFYNGFEPLRVALQIRNLLDERYVEGTERPNYSQFGSPTAVLVTVQSRFDARWLDRLSALAKRVGGRPPST